MKKTTNIPTHYYVRYEDNALFEKERKRRDGYAELCDPDNYVQYQDVATLAQARNLCKALEHSGKVTGPTIFERVNIHPMESEYRSNEERIRGENPSAQTGRALRRFLTRTLFTWRCTEYSDPDDPEYEWDIQEVE